MVVAHNLKAMNSQRQLSMVGDAVSKKSEKLSSGYKVNRAADDAAGLSISEKMRKQIRGLTQATENAEDGISMVQTADGALGEVHEMLQRMNELCTQAANGTNAESDRLYIQDEVTQLRTEIDRVAETTKFNETYLLDGSLAKPGRGAYTTALDNRKLEAVIRKYEEDKEKLRKELEKKAKEREEQNFTIKALTGENAGREVTAEELDATEGIKIVYIKDEVVTQQSQAGDPTVTGYDELKRMLQEEIVPNAVLSIIDAYSPAYDFLKGSSIGMGLKLATGMGNTLAYVGLAYYPNATTPKLMYQLAVSLDALTMTDNSGKLTEASRNELEVTIVHEMMHAFMDEALTNGMTGNAGATARFPKWFIEGMAQSAAGGYYNGNDWVNASLGIGDNSTTQYISNVLNNFSLSISGQENANGYVASYGTGYLASMYLGYLAGGSSLDAASIKTGLGKILGEVRGGKSLEDVIKNLTGKASMSAFESSFASDGAQFVKDLTVLVGNGAGGVVGNLTTPDDILVNNGNPQVTLFKLDTGNDAVWNTYPSDYGVWVGGSATTGGTAGSTTPTGGTQPWNPPDKPLDIAANKRSGMGGGAALHVGADADMTNKIMLYIDAMDSESIGVDKVDVRTVDSATISIERVALALARVSAQRSELGAIQNRLEHTIKNLGNVVENTTAAESLIRDTDMAKEMVAYSNVSILQQAGQSMLAQMNQSNQGALALID